MDSKAFELHSLLVADTVRSIHACLHCPSLAHTCRSVLQIDCLTGLVEAKVANTTAQGKPKNFDEWIMRVMGEGIANLFMRPYNFKVCCAAQQQRPLKLLASWLLFYADEL